MSTDDLVRLSAANAFERKVRRARWAMLFETFWRRMWFVLAVSAVFLAASLLGLWTAVGTNLHIALLGAFGVAFAAALGNALWLRLPSRDEAVDRIEKVSGVPHRPASSFEDTLTAAADRPETRAIWLAHRARMAAALEHLTPGPPQPRADLYDRLALRALIPLLTVAGLALAGASSLERLQSAFDIAGTSALAEARLDAWVAPPPYTGKPPVMLANGATPVAAQSTAQIAGETAAPAAAAPEVPERSIVIVRAAGLGTKTLALDVTPDGAEKALRIVPDAEATPANGAAKTTPPGDVQEIRYEILGNATLRVSAADTELGVWPLKVIPDATPKIALAKKPEVTPRGSLKISFKAEDDYGVAAARVKLVKAPAAPSDGPNAWAAAEPPKGARPPLRRPPEMPLALPKANAKLAEGQSYFDSGAHPWAGLRVTMTLEARDVAGKTGESEPVTFILPAREFKKPLARAVVEQRRKLIDDPRWRPAVAKALDALSMAPVIDEHFADPRVYLGFRTVVYRLERDRTRAGLDSVVSQLWQLALRIEDGNLSDAERAMREAYDKLSKALESGASEEEIKKLMAELKEAMKNYMQELAKDGAEKGDQENADGKDEQNQEMSEEDLEKMLENMEEMAKNGAREDAQKMLSEMRDMMERMQSGQQSKQQAEQNRQMQENLRKLSDLAGEQQKLMDETFEQRRGETRDNSFGKPNVKGGPGGERDRNQAGGKQGQQGQRAQGGQTQRGQQGGQQQPGQEGSGSEPGQGQEGMGGLSARQQALRERLSQLQKQMAERGQGGSEELRGAEQSMQQAEEALREGKLGEANQHQGEALEQMREGSEQMAEQMARNSPQRMGRNGDAPRDPLGRPQRSQGPELGTSVKVPDKIDAQQAREILEELRRRLGETTRQPVELDYLERLLRRF